MARLLKVVTYNVHACVGCDGKLDPARVAEVIEETGADIVGLQELDVGRSRSGGLDQADYIASHVQMTSMFHPAVHKADEKYGDAILTALPMKTIKTGELPGRGEPRGVIWCEIDFGGRPIYVFNTHLGVRRHQRRSQLATLLGEEWLNSPACVHRDCILLGDFNAVPVSPAFRTLASTLQIARPDEEKWRPRPTYPSWFPVLRLDHIFQSGNLRCVASEVVRTRKARAASDHLPLTATFALT